MFFYVRKHGLESMKDYLKWFFEVTIKIPQEIEPMFVDVFIKGLRQGDRVRPSDINQRIKRTKS